MWPKSGIDVEQLKQRIRFQVQVNNRRGGLGDTKADLAGLALDRDKAFSDVLQFHLDGGKNRDLQKLTDLREQARQRTEVSSWIPKPFRRWFRKQGNFNKIVLEAFRVVEKTQRDLVKQNQEVRAYLAAHYYWFRDFVERRIEDRAMINALDATSTRQERTSRTIQDQIDRQAEGLQGSDEFATSILEQLELHMKRVHDLNAKLQAVERQAAELRRSLEQERDSRTAIVAELTSRLEGETQARTSASAGIEQEIAVDRARAAELTDRQSEIISTFAELERRFSGEAAARAALQTELATANASFSAAMKGLQDTLRLLDERQVNESAYIKAELSLQQQVIHDRRLPEKGKEGKSRPGAVAASDGALDPRFDAFYLAFENRFRGSRQEIKGRFAYYLPHLAKLRGAKKTIRALDVGCGRGEWLELLKENHYSNVSGVDSNSAMVAQCRERGLDIVLQDGLKHLSTLKPSSLNLVTAFHVIEHLPFEHLMRLLGQCYRVLKRGGMVILETPNPDNLIVATKNFYTDPTHLRPLPSVLTSFLVEHVGFTEVNTFNQHPFGSEALVREQGELAARFNELCFSAQDYAIIARKP